MSLKILSDAKCALNLYVLKVKVPCSICWIITWAKTRLNVRISSLLAVDGQVGLALHQVVELLDGGDDDLVVFLL